MLMFTYILKYLQLSLVSRGTALDQKVADLLVVDFQDGERDRVVHLGLFDGSVCFTKRGRFDTSVDPSVLICHAKKSSWRGQSFAPDC